MDLRTRALLGLIAAFTLLAFAAYAHDKRRARAGGRRVPEATLIALGALGPLGAWTAVLALRHKTRKAWFLARLALASALLPALVWALGRG